MTTKFIGRSHVIIGGNIERQCGHSRRPDSVTFRMPDGCDSFAMKSEGELDSGYQEPRRWVASIYSLSVAKVTYRVEWK